MFRLNVGRITTQRLMLGLLLLSGVITTPAGAGVTVTIGEPGFYGRLDIGGFPQPALLYPRPTVVYQQPAAVEPLYLRVPPDHRKHWQRHCQRYGACGVPVYFVRDDWYRQRYVPLYQARHGRDGWRDEHDDHRHKRHKHHRHDHDHGHDHRD